MKHSQGSTLETLRGIAGFLDANSTRFAPLLATTTPAELQRIIAALAEHAMTQEDGTRASEGETSKRRKAVTVLRKHHMAAIAAVAKLRLPDVPDFSSMTLPAARTTPEQLVAAGQAMAEASRRHEAVLIAGGLEPDFIAQLDAATAAVQQSVDARKQHRVRRGGATSGLSAAERDGRTLIKSIDARVVRLTGSDEELLGAWRTVKRIPKKTRVRAAAPAPAPAPVTAPPAPAPAPAPEVHAA